MGVYSLSKKYFERVILTGESKGFRFLTRLSFDLPRSNVTTRMYIFFDIQYSEEFNDKDYTYRLNVLASVHALLERPPSFDSSHFKQINRG